MFKIDQILTFLITVSVSLISGWFIFHLNRKKYQAETEKTVIETFVQALNELRKERDEDRQLIAEMQIRIREQQLQYENCEFEHQITKLQFQKTLRRLELQKWVKSSVYVLDTDKKVIDIFIHRFRTISVLFFKAFIDPAIFFRVAKKEKPEILIMDYHLSDNGKTAEEVIKELNYEPAIFIMGSDKELAHRFKGTEIKFFYKDQYYVRDITKAILEYLIQKNA